MDPDKLDKLITEGIPFKRGRDESQPAGKPRYTKPKGKTISGAAKMRAAYRAKKAGRPKK